MGAEESKAPAPAPARRGPIRQRVPSAAAAGAAVAAAPVASEGSGGGAAAAAAARGGRAGVEKRGAPVGVGAAAVQAQFEEEGEKAVIEFDRSKLEKEVVTIAELKRRLGAVLSDGEDGTSAADRWRQPAGVDDEEGEGGNWGRGKDN